MVLLEKLRELDELVRLLEIRVSALETAQQLRLDMILRRERPPEAINQASAVDDVKPKT